MTSVLGQWCPTVSSTSLCLWPYVLQNFVGLFENYKDVERTYIRLQLKRLPARDNELNQSLQSIIGRNYTSKLEAFTKEVGTAMSIKGTLKIFTISKLLYPR